MESDGEPIGFATVVEAAYKSRVALFANGYYRTPEIYFDPKTATGRPFHYFAYAAAVTEVEVDGFTGEHRVLRADLLEDVGDSFLPLIDRGQIEGGFVQGLGWLTLEELLWDDQGRLATAGASTYKLPSWPELPEAFDVEFLERATEPSVIFGSKAVGEPPLMLAISAREAIRDAIAAFGDGGLILLDSPATPERIFWAIQRARQERVATFGGGNGSRHHVSPQPVDLWRATIFHTPQNPFHHSGALVSLPDGGLATQGDKIVACGDFAEVQRAYPQAAEHDLRGGFLLPGFIDTHLHYPQGRILGGLGLFPARLAGSTRASGGSQARRCRVCSPGGSRVHAGAGQPRHHYGPGIRIAFRRGDGRSLQIRSRTRIKNLQWPGYVRSLASPRTASIAGNGLSGK